MRDPAFEVFADQVWKGGEHGALVHGIMAWDRKNLDFHTCTLNCLALFADAAVSSGQGITRRMNISEIQMRHVTLRQAPVTLECFKTTDDRCNEPQLTQ